VDNAPYKEIIGSFIWAMINIHLNLVYLMRMNFQYMANLRKLYWQVIRRLFKCIQGTLDYYRQYTKETNPQPLLDYTNVDWRGHYNTRRSTSNFIFIFTW